MTEGRRMNRSASGTGLPVDKLYWDMVQYREKWEVAVCRLI